MNSSKTQEILKDFQHMIDENSAIVSDKVTESFKSGKIAMIENGIWPLEDFKKAGWILELQKFHPFMDNLRRVVIHSAGIAMAKDSKEKDIALEIYQILCISRSSKNEKD